MIRSTLLKLSESKSFARWVTSNPTTRRMSHRFVAGEALDEAIAAARECNDQRMLVSLDYLGENVSTTDDSQRARDAFLEVFDRIAAERLDANVSCKLTQLGLDVSAEFCEGQLLSIVERARSYSNFLRVDMEGSLYTARTIDVVKRVRSQNPAVGTVIQAYLYRSEQDVQDLLAYGCRIRLCKGAYKEPPEIAFQKKSEVDANYVKLMKILMKSGIYHGLATHDEDIIKEAKAFATRENIPRDAFEFQMLHGIRRDLQQALVRDGWRMRVYIPFGTEWYPYFMRRLAERPANVFFIAKNILRS